MALDLLRPLERRTHCVRPADGIMVVRLPGSNLISAGENVVDVFLNTVEEGHLIEQSLTATFRAGSVVAGDKDHHGVIELASFANGIDHTADIVVSLLQEPCVDLHETRIRLFLVCRA